MKLFITLLTLFVTTSCFSQNLVEKYNSLYERYEYYDSRNNLVGYKKYNSLRDSWEYYEVGASSYSGGYQPPQVLDYDLLYKALMYKQNQYDTNLQNSKLELERQQAEKKREAISLMNMVIDAYNASRSYPSRIADGWHDVYSMNKVDFCAKRKVYVQNNRITKYVVTDRYWAYRTVDYSPEIQNGKTAVTIKEDEGNFLQIFFLDYMSNPNKRATPPPTTGKVSFWSNSQKGKIYIVVEEQFIGIIEHYFSSAPSCQNSGTITYENKPGTYDYAATNGTNTWQGTITIKANGCSTMGLKK